MAARLELQNKLEELIGSRNVYYQPPESIKLSYPAIVYHKNKVGIKHANDRAYMFMNSYTITVVDRKPDNPVIEKLLQLPYCSYDTNFVSDNLEHDVLTLYY